VDRPVTQFYFNHEKQTVELGVFGIRKVTGAMNKFNLGVKFKKK
jgi:hypothetical protein